MRQYNYKTSGENMPEVAKLFVLKDEKRIVTRMIAEGVQQDNIRDLCIELSRCCGHSVTCTKFEGSTCHLMPCGVIKIPNSTEMRDFLMKTSGDFFGAIYVKRDVLAHKKKMLINRLKTVKDLSRFIKDKQKIAEMINYLDLEGWDCTCDNEDCTNVMSITDVIKNLSLECPACLLK